MLIRGKRCMLQPSDNNNHIEESAGKANIQYFSTLTVKLNMLCTRWNAYYAKLNMLENQRRHLI